MDLTTALYTRLAAASGVTSRIGTFNSRPAIFSDEPVPEEASLPFVVIAQPVAVVPWDDYGGGRFGYDVTRDVRCYAARTGSSLPIDALAHAVRDALHRQPLTISGHAHVMTICTNGPVVAPTSEASVVGRILTFRIVAQET